MGVNRRFAVSKSAVGCTGCKLRIRRGSPTVGKTMVDRTRSKVLVRRVQSAGKTYFPGTARGPLTQGRPLYTR
jgi:hypothetical protein